jgi:hypothetical protein
MLNRPKQKEQETDLQNYLLNREPQYEMTQEKRLKFGSEVKETSA